MDFVKDENVNANAEELWNSSNAELWSVLIDKTDGTAKSKVKDAEVGLQDAIKPGIDAFRRLHAWYTLVGGQGISALRTKLIAPKQVPDNLVIQALEQYERDTIRFHELGGEPIPDSVRGQALKNMLTGRTQEYITDHCFEMEYTRIKEMIFRYATRREEQLRKPEDINNINVPSGQDHYSWQYNHNSTGGNYEPVNQLDEYGKTSGLDIFAALRGKAKGNGKFDGCFECGGKDHIARNCPTRVKEKGKGTS